MRARALWIATPLALLAILPMFAACDDSLPGTQLGTFNVVGTIATNTCGAGVGAPSPWDFSIGLSKDATTIYWSTLDGSPLLSGTETSANVLDITSSQQSNVDATDAGNGPCTMERDDAISITLSSATSPGSFTGTYTYSFSAVSGSTCTDQLSANGGGYDTLPCTLSYALTGTRQ